MFTLETIVVAGKPTLAIVRDGAFTPVAAAGKQLGVAIDDVSLMQHLARWDEAWPRIANIAERLPSALAIRGATPVPQFDSTSKVLCAGANYYKHLVEMNVPYVHDATRPPFFFMKPQSALAGPGKTLPLDHGVAMLDWEVEMTVVIGRRAKDVALADALEHVAGYTVSVDMTARDRLMKPESLFKFDFLQGKGQHGYCPTATGFVPAAFVNPKDARLHLAVNGVTKQHESTSDMIYSVAELVMWASRNLTLEPGDLMLTGSPAGVGFPRREFLKVGDVVRFALQPHVACEVEVVAKA